MSFLKLSEISRGFEQISEVQTNQELSAFFGFL
jgi:hypothetical protein